PEINMCAPTGPEDRASTLRRLGPASGVLRPTALGPATRPACCLEGHPWKTRGGPAMSVDDKDPADPDGTDTGRLSVAGRLASSADCTLPKRPRRTDES